MNYEAWRFWMGVAQLVGTLAIGVYVWWSNREKITNKRFRALETDVAKKTSAAAVQSLIEKHVPGCPNVSRTAAVDGKLTRLEAELRSMPGRTEIQHLNDNMSRLSNDMGKLQGKLGGINRAVDLINEFLINQGGKK